eukprot:c37686_g1_i1 orf=286-516(+)
MVLVNPLKYKRFFLNFELKDLPLALPPGEVQDSWRVARRQQQQHEGDLYVNYALMSKNIHGPKEPISIQEALSKEP